MNNSTPAPAIPASSARERKAAACGRCAASNGRTKWLVATAALLLAAALMAGSFWPGFAAMLPLLYVLPCLFMLAMCMKNGTGNAPSGGSP